MSEANIHSRAMLASLSISTWSARKFDKKISDEVNKTHAASRDAGRYNKHLLGGKNAARSHAAVIAAGSALRIAYYEQTLPWTDEGWRLLPSKNFQKFTDEVRKLRAVFDAAVAEFLADYPDLRATAKQLLNGMYREEDYPKDVDIKGRFGVAVNFNPLPAAGDFRLDLPADQVSEIERSAAERVSMATAGAMRSAWERLRESVERVRERLAGQDNIFRDSLIENVRGVVDVLSRLNVTEDQGLETMRQRVAAEIADLDPQSLRENMGARNAAVSSADAILAAMQNLYGIEAPKSDAPKSELVTA